MFIFGRFIKACVLKSTKFFFVSMTKSLNDFIHDVRTANTIEDEHFYIATEQAQIRAFVKACDETLRPRIVSKLIFLDILGTNPSWGQIEAIHLMGADRLSYKRIGYIGASILFDETQDLTVLVTQTLLKDLGSVNHYVKSLALNYIANVGTAEVCRSIAPAVRKLLNDEKNPYVLKRIGMAIIQIIKHNPDLIPSFKNSVQILLNNQNHAVIISGSNLVIEMIKQCPKLSKIWSQFTTPFTRILKALMNNRGSREYSFNIFNDPYLMIKIMKVLGLMQSSDETLEGVLQQVVCSTEAHRNTGRAILYQAVETVVNLTTKSSLKALAFNQVGRLLSMDDPNVLYSALSTFARILNSDEYFVTKKSTDNMALQRYKNEIVKCLDHKDPSIRRRALDVISALIDETNIETLIPEILSFVKLSDNEFRTELVTKIYTAAEKFSPNDEWFFNTILQIFVESGNYVSSDIISSFCELISSRPLLQQHAVKKLTESLVNFNDNQSLMQVSSFVLGEYSRDDNGIVETFQKVLSIPQTTVETSLYILTALAKIAIRLGLQELVLPIVNTYTTANNVEIQQRSGEIIRLLVNPKLANLVLAPISSASDQAVAETTSSMITQKDDESSDSEVDDLLMLVMDDAGQSQQAKQSTPKSSLHDLLGDLTPSVPAQPQNTSNDLLSMISSPQPQPQQIQQPDSIELLRKSDFIIHGRTKPNPSDPRQIALQLVVINTGSAQLQNFKMEFQMRPGWQVQVQPPSSAVLLPSDQPPLTQVLYLFNQNNSPFGLQIKFTYKFGSQPINETGVINSIQ